MSTAKTIRVLLVEDNPTDILLMREACMDVADASFDVVSVERLADACDVLRQQHIDIVLLDLGLPDSQGVDTFLKLHAACPGAPVVVLTGLEDTKVGTRAMQNGAQDYLVKREIDPPLLGKAVRYAIERVKLQHSLDELKQREANRRNMESIEQMSAPLTTTVTARMYAGDPLRNSLPEEYRRAVEQYGAMIHEAMEVRTFKMRNSVPDKLRALGEHLGFLRASPRDVVEICTAALRDMVLDENPLRSATVMEEGRLLLIELMGNLANYYRYFYATTRQEQRR